MSVQRKILLSTFSLSVVISIILTVVIARMPKAVDTADASSVSSNTSSEEYEDPIYTDEDFMGDEDSTDAGNQDGDFSENL